jgi:hypothetical protein
MSNASGAIWSAIEESKELIKRLTVRVELLERKDNVSPTLVKDLSTQWYNKGILDAMRTVERLQNKCTNKTKRAILGEVKDAIAASRKDEGPEE